MLCSHSASGRKSVFLSRWEPLGEDLQPRKLGTPGEDLQPIAFFGDSIS